MEKLKDFCLDNFRLIIVFVILILLFGGGALFFKVSDSNEMIVEDETLVSKEEDDEESNVEENTEISVVTVDLKGAVVQPGTYTVNSEARVIDVLALAGGLLENAETSNINLSKKVFDEMVIVIYTKEKVKEFENKLVSSNDSSSICNDDTLIKNDACVTPDVGDNSSNEGTLKVSINNASLTELMKLPGVGESKARLIIEYRDTNGNFQNLEELKNVKGIGDSIFEKIKENITL